MLGADIGGIAYAEVRTSKGSSIKIFYTGLLTGSQDRDVLPD